MTEITGLEPLVADEPRWFAQMATMPLPPCDTAALKQRLYDDYLIEIPATGWGEVPCLRVSVQGYNTRSDIERLLEAVRTLLPTVLTRHE
jgi:isopenicillin-N epimerase